MRTPEEVYADIEQAKKRSDALRIILNAQNEANNEGQKWVSSLARWGGRREITDIFKRNYAATVRRGLITPETQKDEFCNKIYEETEELCIAVINSDKMNECEELADIALVCFAMAEHYGIDLIDEMRKKVEYNEKRED